MSLLTWQEGVALDVLGVLLGRGSLPSFEGYTPPNQLRPQFTEVVADRIVRRCLEELVRRGGFRPRTVLRQGKRVQADLLDGTRELDFRFTECSQRFAEQATRQLPMLSRAEGSARKAGTGKRQLRDMLISTDTAPGDWLFLALVEDNLPRLALSQEALSALVPRIRQCSPLAWLLALGGSGQLHDSADRLLRLLQPDAVLLVECLDDLFLQRWRRAFALIPETVSDHEGFVRRWSNTSQVLRQWLALLDEHRRLDLARALMLSLSQGAEELRQHRELRQRVRQASDARNMREIDQATAAVADVLGLVGVLAGHADAMRGQRYGDERYEEAQVFLGDWEQILGDRESLMAMERELRGVIG